MLADVSTDRAPSEVTHTDPTSCANELELRRRQRPRRWASGLLARGAFRLEHGTKVMIGSVRRSWKRWVMVILGVAAFAVIDPSLATKALEVIALLAIGIGTLVGGMFALMAAGYAVRGHYVGLLIRDAELRHDDAVDDAAHLERRIEILKQSRDRRGWRYVANGSKRSRPPDSPRLAGQGWRKIALAPVTVPLFLAGVCVAAVRALSRWEALHADDGYAEPPTSIVRAITLCRQLPPDAMSVVGIVLMWVLPAIVIVEFSYVVNGAGSHPADLAAGALVWGLVLTIPGELPRYLRGRVRLVLWLVGIATLVWIGQLPHHRSEVDAFLNGMSFTVRIDLAGLVMLMLLVAARTIPDEGEWKRIPRN